LLLLTGLLLCGRTIPAESIAYPKGLMLNMDFLRSRGGLIPNKALFPLYVPHGELKIQSFGQRRALVFRDGQGLDIPHSALLDPDGSEWSVSIRLLPAEDGIIFSQANDSQGFAIRMVEGTFQAVLRTSHSSVVLKERDDGTLTDYKNKWVTVELRIKPDMAVLLLNRRRVSMIPLDKPLAGKNMHMRMGTHRTLPEVFRNVQGWKPVGFTGAISSLKVHRQ
ncbi:MAG: hypothetical protein KJN98_00640, partial [Pontiella sp.]|nr:hypothetical protein [Pontiella sp.]